MEYWKQRFLREWLDKTNAEIFEPVGMYAAFRTEILYQSNSSEDGGCSETESSWLVVALEASDKEALRKEPIFWVSNSKMKIVPYNCASLKCWCFQPRCV
jgi:hypothetical protein